MSSSPKGSPLPLPNISYARSPSSLELGPLLPNAADFPRAAAQDSIPCTAPFSAFCAASSSGEKTSKTSPNDWHSVLNGLYVFTDALGVIGWVHGKPQQLLEAPPPRPRRRLIFGRISIPPPPPPESNPPFQPPCLFRRHVQRARGHISMGSVVFRRPAIIS